MKNYKGRGEHSVNQLEKMIEERDLLINSLISELDGADGCIWAALKRMDDEDSATEDFLETRERIKKILDEYNGRV